jgi:queuine tRNA-ribosyltransferase catalytic subunit
MGGARDAILSDTYPAYLKRFFRRYFRTTGYPRWCVEALREVGVDLLEDEEGGDDAEGTRESNVAGNIGVVEGDGARWEYSI